MKEETFTKRIGLLLRTARVTYWDWGASVVVEDHTDGTLNSHFTARRFYYSKNCTDINSLTNRIKNHYKL